MRTLDAYRIAMTGLLLLSIGCSRKPPYEGRSVAELERMLADPKPSVQAQGAFGLGLLGEKAKPAVPALVRALGSPDTLVRQQAALSLGQIGDAEAVPALATALRDKEWTIRRQAAVALGSIGPPAREAEAALRKCERDAHAPVRKAATEALARIRGKAGAVP
jgi:HEAT repeat protein